MKEQGEKVKNGKDLSFLFIFAELMVVFQVLREMKPGSLAKLVSIPTTRGTSAFCFGPMSSWTWGQPLVQRKTWPGT